MRCNMKPMAYMLPYLLLSMTVMPGCSSSKTDHIGGAEKHSIAVKAVSVAQQEIRRTTLQPATISAYFEARIQARISGYATEIRADLGDFVKQGDVLAVLDLPAEAKQKETILAQIQRLTAEESRAESEVQLAKSSVQAREATLAQTRAEAIQADATLTAAEAEFQRTRDLVEHRSLESRVLDEVTMRRDAAQANRQAVASAIASAAANVNVANAQVAAALAAYQVTKSETLVAHRELEELEVYLGFGFVRAPFAGVVTSRSVELGDLVDATRPDRPLFTVSQIDKVRVHIPVPENDAPLIDHDDTVSIILPSFRGEDALQAKVTRTSNKLDPQTRTMLVEAEIDNADGKLLPGMFGHATIQLGNTATAQTLPARAIRHTESGGAYVYRVNDDSTLTIVQVTTGHDDGKTLEVVSGLLPGERVVDAHIQRFVDGQSVTVLAD